MCDIALWRVGSWKSFAVWRPRQAQCPQDAVPADLSALVEERLGQLVAGADSQGGGFTNGFASRLRLADGSRVFVRAVSRRQNPGVFASYQREVLVARALPQNVPAPRLRWTAERDECLVLAVDDVAGLTPSGPGNLSS